MEIPIGKTEEKIYLSVFRSLKISYSSPIDESRNLKFLDVKLLIDGKEILPDNENYEAAFFDAFRPQQYKPFDKKDCCENLEKTLQFDKTKEKEANLFGVNITKNYKSLENLPPNIEVLLTAITDQGTTEKRWKLKLITYEERDIPFIRIH